MEVTKAALRLSVRGLVGDDDNVAIPRFGSDMLNEWLADELETLSAASSWANVKATEALELQPGLAEYALPFQADEVDAILDPDTWTHWGVWVDDQTFWSTTPGEGAKPIWTLRGNPIKLRIKPTPASAQTVLVELDIHPTLPIDDRGSVFLRPELRDAVVYAVAARCHERERDFDMAQRRRDVANNKMELLRSNSDDQSNAVHVLRIVT